MPDSEKKDRAARRADALDKAKLGLARDAQRDESTLYGDEADIPPQKKARLKAIHQGKQKEAGESQRRVSKGRAKAQEQTAQS